MGTLRILGGTLKGRVINFPDISRMRPIESIIRKSLFDILSSFPEKDIFIDLFAGSGTVGFEALSRGFHRVIFIENDSRLTESILVNAHKLAVIENIDVILGSIPGVFTDKMVFSTPDVIFLDPPYRTDIIEETIYKMISVGMIERRTLVAIKHSKMKSIKLDKMNMIKVRRFGGSVLSIMKLK